jgi:murein L,D-transpeptidase YcbB/YkuD
MLPWILAAGVAAWGGYELFKKNSSKPKTTTSPSQPSPLVLNVKNLAAQAKAAVTGGAAPQPSVVQSGAATVTDPIVGTASLVANAILHGHATDPAVQQLVKAFQRAVGLTDDGKYGPQTRAMLGRYVTNPPPAPAIYGGTG